MLPKTRNLAAAVVLGALALGASTQLFEIRTSGGFLFDVMVQSSMGMSNGLRDAYDYCYMLRVGSTAVETRSAAVLFGGRGLQSPRVEVGGMHVSRQVFVPEQGDWARYYDLVINRSKTSQAVEVEIYGNLGSDGSTKIVGTSDGDQVIETTDLWFSTDDHVDGDGDPALAHVFRRERGKLAPESVTLIGDDISIRYRLKLPPGKSAAIVFFAVQTQTGAEAGRLATELARFGAPAREHLGTAELALIAN